jgi:hypothetical protein
MASFVGRPRISVARTSGPNFIFNVSYTANFTQADRGFPEGFAESMALFESDRGSFTGGDNEHYLNMPIRTFRPTSEQETHTFTFTLDSDALDTELGGEEIFARVHLRRNIDGLTSATIDSDVFPLAV